MGKPKERKPWQLTPEEIADIKRMSHADLLKAFIQQKEQVNRFMRALTKLKQSISEMKLLGF